MIVNNCEDCKIHELIKNHCDESVLQEFIDNYCNKCDTNIKEYTQDEFIRIIESRKTDSTFRVGDIIHLNHDLCDTFKVIDVNHDGDSNTVDIMPVTQVGVLRFGDYDNSYENSVVRKWINSLYIHGFDDNVYYLLRPMAVSVDNDYLYNEFAKILSASEIGLKDKDALYNEGTKYPIFNEGYWDDSIESRWVADGDYGDSYSYWLRSKHTADSSYIWRVNNAGACRCDQYRTTCGVIPLIRF